jgi:hypothetical protein
VRGGLGSEKAVPREQGRTNVAGEARMRAMHSDVKTQKTGEVGFDWWLNLII